VNVTWRSSCWHRYRRGLHQRWPQLEPTQRAADNSARQAYFWRGADVEHGLAGGRRQRATTRRAIGSGVQ
jgi:hypothetical protein